MLERNVKQHLLELSKRGSIPGLERVNELLRMLGMPQDRLKCIHVAGTNGKGSVCAMLSSVFSAAGYKTGMFTSPCIFEANEQLKINGESISAERFEKLHITVGMMLDRMENPATEFEFLTAMAYQYFMEEGCDIAIIETGMGGRLDATNVLSFPECAVITSIGMDHMSYLGDTIEKIASEKAGIIMPGCSVVYSDNGEEVNKVILNRISKLSGESKTENKYATREREGRESLGTREGKNEEADPGGREKQNEEANRGIGDGKNEEASFEGRERKNEEVNPGTGEGKNEEASFGGREGKNEEASPGTGEGKNEEVSLGIREGKNEEANFGGREESGRIRAYMAGEGRINALKTCEDLEGGTELSGGSRMKSGLMHFDYKQWKNIEVSLIGSYQLKNAALVLDVVEAMRDRGWRLDEKAVRAGLSLTEWPARFQIMCRDPLFIADGGHNVQCIEELTKSLGMFYAGKRFICLTGVMADKAYQEMYELLNPFVEAYIATTPRNPRALKSEELCHYLLKYGKKTTYEDSPADAVTAALKMKEETADIGILAVGSLYMMGEIIAEVRRQIL